MSNDNQNYAQKLKKPDIWGPGPNGQRVIVDKSWRPTLWQAHGQPDIHYLPTKNMYLDRGGNVIEDSRIAEMPIRWKYSKCDGPIDELNPETGDWYQDDNPPTTAAIAAKRKELTQVALKAEEQPNLEKIEADTCPTMYLVKAAFQRQLDNRTPDERLAATLKKTFR